MLLKKAAFNLLICLFLVASVCAAVAARAEMVDYPVVKLQSLDKVTARTMTFEARVGSTVKFGSIYIRIQSCRKAPPIEKPESASFLQVWEVTSEGDSKWIFSGWMFASSPALSPMDHPIYDVWVLDCLDRKSSDPAPEKTPDNKTDKKPEKKADSGGDEQLDGEVMGDAAEPPRETPPKPKVHIPGFDAPEEASSDQVVPLDNNGAVITDQRDGAE